MSSGITYCKDIYYFQVFLLVPAKGLMMFKHHIGDVPKLISNLFQTNNNYRNYSTCISQLIKISPTLDRWLGIIYLVNSN